MKSDRTGCVQYGVVPYRIVPQGGVEVLLLTSRDTGRWVIPKGWPIRGLKPRAVAATEAREEAGVEGRLTRKPVGAFPYTKIMSDGEHRLCECVLFLLRVTQEHAAWPEQAERRRAWFPQDQAAERVEEGTLALIIRGLLASPERRRTRQDVA